MIHLTRSIVVDLLTYIVESKIIIAVRETLLGENMWQLLILELSLIKNVLKGLGRELTAPHHRQLVCYNWYAGPRA